MPDVYFSEIDFGDGIARKPRVAGSGGHTIVDESGTQFTQRANLVVENAHVEDDATNNATVLKSKNFVGHKSVWDAMTREEKFQYETYDFDDDFNGQTVDATPTQGSTNPVQSGGVYSEIQTIEGEIQTVSNQVATKASQTDLNNVSQKVSKSSDAYSPSKPYKVGDLVIYDNKLYRCITACSAAAWSVNQGCFTADTLTNVVTSLTSAKQNKTDASLGTSSKDIVGAINELNNGKMSTTQTPFSGTGANGTYYFRQVGSIVHFSYIGTYKNYGTGWTVLENFGSRFAPAEEMALACFDIYHVNPELVGATMDNSGNLRIILKTAAPVQPRISGCWIKQG